jgi:hypothetical protein
MPRFTNLFMNTIETVIIVIKIKIFPIKKVKENFEIFLTQAIGISMQDKRAPITSAETYKSNVESRILLMEVVTNDICESEKENCVPKIMKSRIFLAFDPRIFAVIKEYDLMPVFLAHSTSFKALKH